MRHAIVTVLGALIVALMATTLLCAATWANSRWGTGPDSLPGWIEALSTFAAFVAAVVAVAFAAGAFRLEARRESRWQAESRRGQAALIAGWFEGTPVEMMSFFGNGYRTDYEAKGDLNLRNASDLPVTDVRVVVTWTRGASAPVDIAGLDTLPPGDEPLRIAINRTSAAEIAKQSGTPRIALSFTDAAGIRWRRLNGELTEDT